MELRMSKKDDKHLELIKKRGFLDRSPESLKNFQVKITKLANSLRKDILQNDVSDFFTKSDLQAIEQAAIVLTQFKETVAHAKEHQKREQERKARINDALCDEAKTLIQSRYPHSASTKLNKLRFSLSVAYIEGTDEFGYFIDDLKQRLERHTPEYLAAFPTWIDNQYINWLRHCISNLVGYNDEQLDPKRLEKTFDRLDKALKVIDEKGGNVFHDAAWYLSKTTDGLSEEDRSKLGI